MHCIVRDTKMNDGVGVTLSKLVISKIATYHSSLSNDQAQRKINNRELFNGLSRCYQNNFQIIPINYSPRETDNVFRVSSHVLLVFVNSIATLSPTTRYEYSIRTVIPDMLIKRLLTIQSNLLY